MEKWKPVNHYYYYLSAGFIGGEVTLIGFTNLLYAGEKIVVLLVNYYFDYRKNYFPRQHLPFLVGALPKVHVSKWCRL